jgi:hypothetical protein
LWVYYIWAARSQADSPRRVRVSGDPPQSRHRSKRLHRPIGMTTPPATSAMPANFAAAPRGSIFSVAMKAAIATSAIALIMPATKSGVMSARQQPMHETPQRMPDTIPVVSRARSRFRKRGPGVLPAGARSAASYRPSVRTIIASRWGRCCPLSSLYSFHRERRRDGKRVIGAPSQRSGSRRPGMPRRHRRRSGRS